MEVFETRPVGWVRTTVVQMLVVLSSTSRLAEWYNVGVTHNETEA